MFNRSDSLSIIQKRDMLFPGDPNHHSQAVLLGKIKKPSRRCCISANGVDAVCGHLRKVCRRHPEIKFIVRFIRPERAVCNAADVEFIFSDRYELARNGRPRDPFRHTAIPLETGAA